ncbi:DUF4352 domain-containing protein [Paenibacillus taichungensis]|uniref:DUF4352 domain-containing protein n=1 Tax=Paenibacillus taichungensis TaxID=484184 RepID=UPI0038D0141F
MLVVGVVFIGLIVWLTVSRVGLISTGSTDAVEQSKPEIGEAVKVGSFYIYINDVSETTDESDGMKVVTIGVTAINKAKEADAFLGSQILLLDTQGNVYNPEISLFGGVTINPGITEKGTVDYHVPASVKITTAMVRAELVDMGGADYVRVNLTK